MAEVIVVDRSGR